MATPGKNSDDIKVRLTKAGMDFVEAEAQVLGVEKVEVVRLALAEYSRKQGKSIDFTPKHGGSRKRESEHDTINLVLSRIKTLGLPEPETEYRLGHKVYDLAWPAQSAAIEISKRIRPTDANGWTVSRITPAMGIAKIDEVLKRLALT